MIHSSSLPSIAAGLLQPSSSIFLLDRTCSVRSAMRYLHPPEKKISSRPAPIAARRFPCSAALSNALPCFALRGVVATPGSSECEQMSDNAFLTNDAAAWQGDWRSRISGCLQERGYDGLLGFLKSNPGTSYVSLAEEVGSGAFGMQLVATAFCEARSKGEFRWAAMDCLVREIRDVFQFGWGRVYIPPHPASLAKELEKEVAEQGADRMVRLQGAEAFGGWASSVKQVPGRVDSLLAAVWDGLLALVPPVGWLPEGPDDPFIVAAFDRGWPLSTVIEYLPVGPHVFCPKCNAVLTPPGDEELSQTCHNCGTAFPLFGFE